MLSAEELLPHLDCDVEFNTYDDGTFTLECNTCCKILISMPFEKPDPDTVPMIPDFNGENAGDVEILTATYQNELENPAKRIPQIEEVPDDYTDI